MDILILLSIVGLVPFFISVGLFDWNCSRVFYIFAGILSLIPLFGFLGMTALLILQSIDCRMDIDYATIDEPLLKTHQVNKWLFNKKFE